MQPTQPISIFKKIRIGLTFILVFIIIGLIAFGIVWFTFFTAPNFSQIKIDEPRFGAHGAAVIYVTSSTTPIILANELKAKGLIKSPGTFLSIIEKFNLGKKIKQGIYVFGEPQNVLGIADRVSKGEYGYEQVRVTIPEGYTTYSIAGLLPEKLVDIKKEDFMKASNGLEGYLFPDTYFFYPYATSSAVIEMMLNNFDRRISGLEKELGIKIDQSSKNPNFAKTIILASILEKEVQTQEDMSLVSDLFLRRMEIGMPLQADSTLTYITGKTSAELTIKDLTTTDPYNSYKNLGLPPTPISNPGINAIRAAIVPKPNKYLFFLSDNDGTTHFSETYAEHLRLKKKYLQ